MAVDHVCVCARDITLCASMYFLTKLAEFYELCVGGGLGSL